MTATATALNAGATYFFALKSEDEALLSSGLSNQATATTTIPQLSWSMKKIYWASWDDYQNRQLSIDYDLGNTGTATAISPTIAASICNPTSVYATTPLPLALADLNPVALIPMTLKYFVPTSVGSFTTTTYAHCQDDVGRTYWFPGPLP